MRTGIVAVASTLLVAAVACGGRSTSGTADTAAIAAYQGLSADVQSAASAYGAAIDAPAMSTGGCPALHDAYDAQVRPWVSGMVQGAGAMDAYLDAHGGAAYADMSCVANAMRAELDAHRAIACTFTTLADDQAEVARHAGVMTSYAAHVSGRCGTMMGGSGGGPMMSWGPVATGCAIPSGGTGGASDPVALGRQIFDAGLGANGQPLVRAGGVGMMGTSGCASCHGLDGHGRTTMMFTSPDVTYANLTDPAGMLAPDGSRGTTYTDDLIRRAVTQGVDADGQPLSTAMPRWQLGDQDWADLLAYLKTLP